VKFGVQGSTQGRKLKSGVRFPQSFGETMSDRGARIVTDLQSLSQRKVWWGWFFNICWSRKSTMFIFSLSVTVFER